MERVTAVLFVKLVKIVVSDVRENYIALILMHDFAFRFCQCIMILLHVLPEL